MSRFESGATLSAVPSPAGPYESAIGRVAGCPDVARALRALAASRTAAQALDVADLSGHRLARPVNGQAGRAIGLYEVGGTETGALMAAVVLGLRRSQRDAYGLRRDMHALGTGDVAVVRALLDADAAAFLVHVAAEAAAAGMPALARHVEASNVLAPIVDAYRRGVRKGGARTGVAMAFSAAAGEEAILGRHVPEAGAAVEGASDGFATRLAEVSPAGGPYPVRGFRQAFDRLRGEIAARCERAAEAAIGMRHAA